jgi:hypothetical protein
MNTLVVNPLFVTVHRNYSKVTYNPIYEFPICSICLEIVEHSKQQCLVCKQITHTICMFKWKKECKKLTCPTCRSEVQLKK